MEVLPKEFVEFFAKTFDIRSNIETVKQILIDASQNNPGTYRYFVELFQKEYNSDQTLHDEKGNEIDAIDFFKILDE